jgi:hypothetical protein
MAGAVITAHTVHTRVVRRRADSRAGTEPVQSRPSTAEEHTRLPTSPYARDYEPADEGRESMPYLEMEITKDLDISAVSERKATERVLRLVKTVPARRLGKGSGPERAITDDPKLGVGTGIERALSTEETGLERPLPSDDDMLVQLIARLPKDDAQVDHVIDRLTEPSGPKPHPSQLTWVGVVVSPPEVGASMMIGTWLRPEFRVTTVVTKLIMREDGMLIQTASKARYIVHPSGDAYLVRDR